MDSLPKRAWASLPEGRGAFHMDFHVVGVIEAIETIAIGKAIRELPRLEKTYGKGRWRKLKGVATVQFTDDSLARAEVHWYEAHGIGRKESKIKRLLEQ
jgi:hypothetical protein